MLSETGTVISNKVWKICLIDIQFAEQQFLGITTIPIRRERPKNQQSKSNLSHDDLKQL